MSKLNDLLASNKYDGIPHFNQNYDNKTRNRINVLKTKDTPFPAKHNRNQDPIFSLENRDIFKNRYKKVKTASISIDSRDRDINLYPNPNNYKVSIPSQFNNIESICLTNINLPNLQLTNNQFSWDINGTNFSSTFPNGIFNIESLQNIFNNTFNQFPPNNFELIIDSSTQNIKIINRCDNIAILSAQTILTQTDDPLFNFSTVQSGVYNKNAVYITINSSATLDNTKPLIISNLKSMSGVPSSILNCKQFWTTPPQSFFGSYSLFDTIDINGRMFNRYELIPKIILPPNNNLITTNDLINAQNLQTQDICVTNSESQFFYNFDNIINSNTSNFNGINTCPPNSTNNPVIGPANSFQIDFGNSNILSNFGWNQNISLSDFIQTNNNSLNVDSPCLNLELGSDGTFYFNTNQYIFLKLSVPSFPDDKLAGNIVTTQNANILNPIFCQIDPRITRDNSNLFAKIFVSSIGPAKIVTSPLQYFSSPLRNLPDIEILFIDRNGCPIDVTCNHTLTIEINEVIDVLKDTSFDSIHGETIETGNYYRQRPLVTK